MHRAPSPKSKLIITVSLLMGIPFLAALIWLLQSAVTEANSSALLYLPAVIRQSPAPPSAIDLQPFAGGFSGTSITDIVNAGDSRLFVVEREGRIRIVQPDGTILSPAFLDISDIGISTANWEQGLLGLVFHPDYANNGFFYVQYTVNPDEDIRIVRYSVSSTDPNRANKESPVLIMRIEKPLDGNGQQSEVHNGGALHFGPDGYLYIGLGDGGPDPNLDFPEPGDTYNNGQRKDKLLGKILRIDVNGTGLPPDCHAVGNYTIPADNPFVDGPGNHCDEIWATGLRNPWRFSFDRDTGNMYIGDVGEWQREEVNFQPAGVAGLNYGWHCWEGNVNYAAQWPEIGGDCGAASLYTQPFFEYDHNIGTCASVTGGYVYRGQAYPALVGQYLFADFCNGIIWRSSQVNGQWVTVQIFDSPTAISTFGEDVNGELYVGNFQHNIIYRVVVP